MLLVRCFILSVTVACASAFAAGGGNRPFLGLSQFPQFGKPAFNGGSPDFRQFGTFSPPSFSSNEFDFFSSPPGATDFGSLFNFQFPSNPFALPGGQPGPPLQPNPVQPSPDRFIPPVAAPFPGKNQGGEPLQPPTVPPPNRFINPGQPPQVPNQGGIPCSQPVRYQLVNHCNWSRQNFPRDHPGDGAFTELVGATHSPSKTFFRVGQLASNNIVAVAEHGENRGIQAETQACINSGQCGEFINLNCNPGTTNCRHTGQVTMTQNNHLISFAAMLFPSPDWFVGVDSANLCPNGTWLPRLDRDVWVYDSGSDSGPTFNSPDQKNPQRQPITQFKASGLSNIFSNPNSGGVAPMCKLTMTLA